MGTGSNKESGFVLVATLWFLATITIVAAYFADQMGKSIESAAHSQRMTDAMVDMANTRAEALFHFATDGFSQWGLGVDATQSIALDDRPYLGTGKDIIRFQDDRGLLNLNFPDHLLLGRLLSSFGVPAEKHPALFDALADYTDIDNFRRLNGAEAAEYQAVKLPPPANDTMFSPHQLKSVYGWHLLNELWDEGRFLPLLTTSRISTFNPTTAPREILVALAGNENIPLVDEILALRKSNPTLANEKALALTKSRSMDSERINALPADSVRITQQSPDLPWAMEINVTLTPIAEEMPWHVSYINKTHLILNSSDKFAIPPLPSASSVSATGMDEAGTAATNPNQTGSLQSAQPR